MLGLTTSNVCFVRPHGQNGTHASILFLFSKLSFSIRFLLIFSFAVYKFPIIVFRSTFFYFKNKLDSESYFVFRQTRFHHRRHFDFAPSLTSRHFVVVVEFVVSIDRITKCWSSFVILSLKNVCHKTKCRLRLSSMCVFAYGHQRITASNQVIRTQNNKR